MLALRRPLIFFQPSSIVVVTFSRRCCLDVVQSHRPGKIPLSASKSMFSNITRAKGDDSSFPLSLLGLNLITVAAPLICTLRSSSPCFGAKRASQGCSSTQALILNKTRLQSLEFHFSIWCRDTFCWTWTLAFFYYRITQL